MRSIRSTAELDAWLAGRYRAESIALELEGMKGEDRERWEQRLNRAYHECGCGAATAALLLGIAGLVIAWLTAPGGLSLGLAAAGVAAVLLVSVLAKSLHKAVARRRLRRDVAVLKHLAGRADPVIRCG